MAIQILCIKTPSNKNLLVFSVFSLRLIAASLAPWLNQQNWKEQRRKNQFWTFSSLLTNRLDPRNVLLTRHSMLSHNKLAQRFVTGIMLKKIVFYDISLCYRQ